MKMKAYHKTNGNLTVALKSSLWVQEFITYTHRNISHPDHNHPDHNHPDHKSSSKAIFICR